MKLLYLNIQGYKNIAIEKKIEDSNGSSEILLIGNNQSGKSNLIEAISLIFQWIYVYKNSSNKKPDPLDFEYKIIYKLYTDNIQYTIEQKDKVLKLQKQDEIVTINNLNLPKRMIAIYSGEESRLWDDIYSKSYFDYLQELNAGKSIIPNILFLNKFYWSISLVSLICSNLEDNKKFLTDIVGISDDLKMIFSFNIDRLKEYKKTQNQVTTFLDTLIGEIEVNEKHEIERSFTIEKIKELFEDKTDLFYKLYASSTDKTEKVISDIDITFNNNVTLKNLSEGIKKLILIKAALEFAGNEDTLYLLDEPDSHIHIVNKKLLIDTYNKYKQNRLIISTTHSPTMCDKFKGDIIYMEHGCIKNTENQNVISDLTNNYFTAHDSFLFLSSKHILLVEGVSDKKYIEKAKEVLEIDDFDFEICSFGGTSNIKSFTESFVLNKATNKLVIFLLDNDDSGKQAVKTLIEIIGKRKSLKNEIIEQNISRAGEGQSVKEADELVNKKIEGMLKGEYIKLKQSVYSCFVSSNENEAIEDLISKNIRDTCLDYIISLQKEKPTTELSRKDMRSKFKSRLEHEYFKNLERKDMEGFASLFAKIQKIKTEN